MRQGRVLEPLHIGRKGERQASAVALTEGAIEVAIQLDLGAAEKPGAAVVDRRRARVATRGGADLQARGALRAAFEQADLWLKARDVAHQRDVPLQRLAAKRPFGGELGGVGLGQPILAACWRAIELDGFEVALDRDQPQLALREIL